MATSKPTIVLVPGAWHFPECFDSFVPFLNDKGYETSKVTLKSVLHDNQTPVDSHHADADSIQDQVQHIISQKKDVVVFARSYGGVPTAEALSGLGKTPETHGVIHIIFCSAVVPAEGQSHLAVVGHPDVTAGCAKDFARLSEDGTTFILIKELTMKSFYPDVDPKVAEEQYSMLGTLSFGAYTSPITKRALKKIPARYVVCKKDRCFEAHVQRWIAEKAGIEDVVEIDSWHSPFLSRPEELAGIMDRIIQRS